MNKEIEEMANFIHGRRDKNGSLKTAEALYNAGYRKVGSDIDEQRKQAKIDVLNKAKEKLDSAPNGWAYTGYIDDLIEELLKEYENG